MKSILLNTLLLLTLGLTISCKKEVIGKPYPLSTCIISGEKLGEMGKPAIIVKNGQEVKFCCKNCIPDFEKDPGKFLKEIEAKAKK